MKLALLSEVKCGGVGSVFPKDIASIPPTLLIYMKKPPSGGLSVPVCQLVLIPGTLTSSPALLRIWTAHASRKIKGRTTISIPRSVKRSCHALNSFCLRVSTGATWTTGWGVGFAAALRVRGVAGALRALVLRAGFLGAAVETVADLADAGIWMLAFVLPNFTRDGVDKIPNVTRVNKKVHLFKWHRALGCHGRIVYNERVNWILYANTQNRPRFKYT